MKDESKSIELVFYFLFVLLAIRAVSVALGLYLRFGGVAEIFSNGDLIYELTRTGSWTPGIGGFYNRNVEQFCLVSLLKDWSLGQVFMAYHFFGNIGNDATSVTLYVINECYGIGIANCGALPKLRLLNIRRILILIAIMVLITMSRSLTSRVSGGGDAFGALAYAGELASVVYYISCGIAGFSEYIRLGVDEYSASYTLNGLGRVLELVTAQEGFAIQFEEVKYYTPTRTITATAFKFIIDDFGVFSLFIMGLLGASVRFFYRSCWRDKSGFKLFIFSALYMTLGFIFFSWTFFIGGFWLYIISGIILIFLTKTNFLRLIIKK